MSIADTTRGRLIALVQTVDDQREAIETFKANRAEAKAQLETVIAEIRSTIKDPEAEPRETMGKLAKLERQRIRRQLELDTVKANMTAAKGEGQLAASQILGILRDLRDGGDLPMPPSPRSVRSWSVRSWALGRLTVSCGVANPKKVNAQTAEHLRTAGYPTLNEVEAFRREHWDKGWRDAFREEVKIGSGYLLTDRNLDGLEESIKTRLGQ